jgi:hypothetical protein
MSWKPSVKCDGVWETNGLVFATKEEAERSAQNLFSRWHLAEGHRAVESDKLVNYTLDEDGVLRPVKQEKANG